ncbi:hypothetical protein TNCV_1698111 [Trichonephila clavipes]|nr:hypothetical protein TNCV_1698111 [Trichonephila clavipes]
MIPIAKYSASQTSGNQCFSKVMGTSPHSTKDPSRRGAVKIDWGSKSSRRHVVEVWTTGCQLRPRPRHLTVVQQDETRHQLSLCYFRV